MSSGAGAGAGPGVSPGVQSNEVAAVPGGLPAVGADGAAGGAAQGGLSNFDDMFMDMLLGGSSVTFPMFPADGSPSEFPPAVATPALPSPPPSGVVPNAGAAVGAAVPSAATTTTRSDSPLSRLLADPTLPVTATVLSNAASGVSASAWPPAALGGGGGAAGAAAGIVAPIAALATTSRTPPPPVPATRPRRRGSKVDHDDTPSHPAKRPARGRGGGGAGAGGGAARLRRGSTAGVDPKELEHMSAEERKRARNKILARECRQRKKQQLQDLEARVKRLDVEKAALEAELQVLRTEAAEEAKEAKRLHLQKLKTIMDEYTAAEARGDPPRALSEVEARLTHTLTQYREKFADYGNSRQQMIDNLLDQLETLIKPTQPDEFFDGPEPGRGREHTEASVWATIANSVGFTRDQIENIKRQRGRIQMLSARLVDALESLRTLRTEVQEKNAGLQQAMRDLQGSMSPLQVIKFISWIDRNQAAMQLLTDAWEKIPK